MLCNMICAECSAQLPLSLTQLTSPPAGLTTVRGPESCTTGCPNIAGAGSGRGSFLRAGGEAPCVNTGEGGGTGGGGVSGGERILQMKEEKGGIER